MDLWCDASCSDSIAQITAALFAALQLERAFAFSLDHVGGCAKESDMCHRRRAWSSLVNRLQKSCAVSVQSAFVFFVSIQFLQELDAQHFRELAMAFAAGGIIFIP